MSSSQKINTRTVAPTVVNPESVLVDSDPEEDLQEKQCEMAAEQAWIKEATKAKIAAAQERIERKRKAKEEEARKAEEEEARKVADARKAKEDEVLREKAKEDARRWQISVSYRFLFYFKDTSVLIRSRY